MATVILEIENNLATITLDRPEVFNSFNEEMAKTFQAALKECRDNAEVRAVYLTGSGKAFCAGQDLQEVTGEDALELQVIVAEHYNPIIELIREIEKPIVAAVNGPAAGAGANIALACDITVAKESSYFMQAFSKIGLIPDSGGTYFLPRIVGRQRAAAMMMLAEKVSAQEAASIGMIYKAFPDEEFEEKSKAIAFKLAKMPTRGLGLTKRALNYSLNNDLTTQLGIEEQLQTTAGNTYDYNEGVQAFLEKRKPEFKGE